MTVRADHRQYSVQALILLAEVTVTLLDVVYRSEEKERVIPLLSNILYNVFPYLKNHRLESLSLCLMVMEAAVHCDRHCYYKLACCLCRSLTWHLLSVTYTLPISCIICL